MNDKIKRLEEFNRKIHALTSGIVMLHWDNSTYGAPKEAIEYTAQDMGTLESEIFATINSPELKELVGELENEAGLSPSEKAIVKEYRRSIERTEKIPKEEYREFAVLRAKAYPAWEEAKLKSDYSIYAPVLKDIIYYVKRFSDYRKKPGQTLYEAALDDYEEGFKESQLEDFFGKLKDRAMPLVKKVAARSDKEPAFMTHPVDIESQRALSKYIAEYIGFNFNRGVLAETEHPFTTNMHNRDVRITTHYYPDQWTFALFSTIHEGGHAIYEQGIGDDITLTPIGGGSTMGLHESQSRFYENNLARGKAFWEPIYGEVADKFLPFLKDVDFEEFYRGINYAIPSLIRTEADELTYPFHIIIRYEMEKLIFYNEVDVKDLPGIWNEKYKEYLGITPPDDKQGILQDMHWSDGNFGYFPTYALGTAVAAQLYHHMEKAIDIEGLLRKGEMGKIKEYLNENIHRYGKMKNIDTVLTELTGEGFNADYYTDYLIKKFG